MTLSTIKEELESARWSLSQAQKELAKYSDCNDTGRGYVVEAAKRELETVFQRIHRAMLIDLGHNIEVPR